MISDILSDAVLNIREWQKSFPEIYGGMKGEIDKVVARMDKLRAKLDALPVKKQEVTP